MNMHRRFLIASLAAGVVTAAGVSNASASSDSSTDQELADMRATMQKMQERIDELESAQGADWLSAARADEIRGLVADVLADADTRSSLLQNGSLAGWDKGFYLASPDGNFRLKVGGQLQIRFVANMQDDAPVDSSRVGFEMRRVRLFFQGHVFDPSWTYDIQVAANRSGGDLQLEDAGWVQKDLGSGWKIRFGQMKAPFLREETLSSIRMLAVERSLLNSTFTAGTVQGVQVSWESDNFRAFGMYHDGNSSANTAWSMEDTEFAFSARGEWLAAGTWGQFIDYNGFRGEGFGVLVGAAVNYSQAEFGTGSNLVPPPPDFNNAEVENFGATIDVTIDFDGASLAGAFVYRNLQTDTGTPADFDLDQIGFFLRGGWFFTEEWELYGLYEWADLDTAGIDELSVITVGVARYWNKHNLKWQTDIGFGLNEINASFANDGAGWRADSAGEDGQIVFRSQFQLVF